MREKEGEMNRLHHCKLNAATTTKRGFIMIVMTNAHMRTNTDTQIMKKKSGEEKRGENKRQDDE